MLTVLAAMPMVCRNTARFVNGFRVGQSLGMSLTWLPRMWRPRLAARSNLAPAQERQPLEQVHILFVLQQRAVQRRDQLARVTLPQHFRRDVLVEQQFQPVEQLRGRRLL